MKHFFVVAIISICLVFGGCKIEITAPEGGSVISKSGSYECSSGGICTVEIYDLFFEEEFIAVANHGFEFLTWRARDGHLCSGPSGPCRIDSSLAQLHPRFMQILESDEIFFLEPLFRKHGVDVLPIGGPISGFHDAYSYEANSRFTRVLDPHKWDKACRIPYYSFTETDFMVIREMEWWGYYDSGDLPGGINELVFEIRFFAAESLTDQGGKIVAKRRFKVKAIPYTWHASQPPETLESLYPSLHEGRMVYRYKKFFSKPVYIHRGDVLFSIVQIDSKTGESDANFIWHAKPSMSGPGTMYFLTDYGGWIAGSASRCQQEWYGYHSAY